MLKSLAITCDVGEMTLYYEDLYNSGFVLCKKSLALVYEGRSINNVPDPLPVV